MKNRLYKIKNMLCFSLLAFGMTACIDKQDIPLGENDGTPKAIDVNAIELTPIEGGIRVSWTPNPEDLNFVFLNIKFIDQDHQQRNYNMSRYNSSLVASAEPDGSDSETIKKDAVTLDIDNLVNQEYKLEFYAYNNRNQCISLGSRTVTPLDYKQKDPDGIYSVTVTSSSRRTVYIEWQEPEYGSASTTDVIWFRFTNTQTGAIEEKTYEPGIFHDTFKLSEDGIYSVTYGTRSAAGKEWSEAYNTTVEVENVLTREFWTAADKRGWVVTASSSQDNEGPVGNLLDGDANTYWSSNWGVTTTPHWVEVDLGDVKTISGVIMQQRQNCAKPSWHRCVKDFAVYVKQNKGDAYPLTPTYEGHFKENNDPNEDDYLGKQNFTFGTKQKGRYIKVEFKTTMFDPSTGNDNNYNMCMAEFGIFETIDEQDE